MALRGLLALLLVCSACGRVGFDLSGRGTASDADAQSFGMLFDPSIVPPPLGSALLTSNATWIYDSDTDSLAPFGSSNVITHASVLDTGRDPVVRILSFDDLDVQGSLIVLGSLPVAIVATTISVGASVDLSGIGLRAGGGAQACAAQPGMNDLGGGGGGGGGGFGAAGGSGAAGDADGGAATGGTGGAAIASTALRGGCAGGAGGDGGDPGGTGGLGGGAILLQAETLTITGAIYAGGRGGLGGMYVGGPGGDAGGGGGGSGGMIVLSANTLVVTGLITANGGGGGEGSQNGSIGAAGDNASQSDQAALGGNGNDGTVANNGGAGGALLKPAGSLAPLGAVGGAGGGGGGVGTVLIHAGDGSDLSAALISPVAQPY